MHTHLPLYLWGGMHCRVLDKKLTTDVPPRVPAYQLCIWDARYGQRWSLHQPSEKYQVRVRESENWKGILFLFSFQGAGLGRGRGQNWQCGSAAELSGHIFLLVFIPKSFCDPLFFFFRGRPCDCGCAYNCEYRCLVWINGKILYIFFFKRPKT